MKDDVDRIHQAAFYARIARRIEEPYGALHAVLERFAAPSRDVSSTAELCLRLAFASVGREKEVRDALREAIGAAPKYVLNRPTEASSPAPSAEAREIATWMRDHAEKGVLLSKGFVSMHVATREVEVSIDGGVDSYAETERTFFIDYPLCAPLVFRRKSSLRFDEIAEVIADAYERIYLDPATYGVIAHDRADLVIESLCWYEARDLIYPQMGS